MILAKGSSPVCPGPAPAPLPPGNLPQMGATLSDLFIDPKILPAGECLLCKEHVNGTWVVK